MSCPTDSCNIYDLESKYESVLLKELLSMGMEEVKIKLNLGRLVGNLLQVPLQHLDLPVDVLVCGPPCPPWAGQGNHKAMRDSRAQVFVTIILWIVYMAHCGGLLVAIVENVKGVLHSYNGLEPAMDKFIRVLTKHVPFFHWCTDTLEAIDYLCPQTRVRTFLRGIRKTISPAGVPKPLSPFGRRPLKTALGNFNCTPRSSFPLQQQANIKVYEKKIKGMYLAGRLHLNDIVVVAADRQEGCEFPQNITVNAAPTFTTNNKALFIMSVEGVVHDVPDTQRMFFRRFMPAERLTCQGFPAKLCLQLGETLTVKASGNAYPPPLIIATLQPCLMALARSGLDLMSWPPADLPRDVPPCISHARSMLNGHSRVTNKRKWLEWQSTCNTHDAHSSDSD
jgi:site-specific DNA-cytosine methylase